PVTQGALLVKIQTQGRCQSGQRHFVETKSAHKRIFFDLLYPFFASGDDAGLRSAEQLIAAEKNQVGPVRHARSRYRLALETEAGENEQRTAADVVDHPQTRPLSPPPQGPPRPPPPATRH